LRYGFLLGRTARSHRPKAFRQVDSGAVRALQLTGINFIYNKTVPVRGPLMAYVGGTAEDIRLRPFLG
ncbi:MAG: hypothetical protein ACI33K_08750, partial [Clostridiaceae bacterium]